MKELNVKNKFRHKLGPRGTRLQCQNGQTKEQELHDARIPDPLEGCTVSTRNWIRGHSRTDVSGQLITSSSEITSVVGRAKTLTTKEKTGEFKSQRERDQLNVALENEEHRGCT
jgi:hypothetical protein